MSKKALNLAEVMPEVNWIKNDDIRTKTIRIWEQMYNDSKWEDIMDLPCSTHKTDYPHITHNRSVVQMAVSVADILEKMHGVEINRDYLICAALLQDVSKLIEYEPDGENGCRMSENGKYYMHSFLAGCAAVQLGLPHEVIQAINTHSPDSSSFPASLIGKILFYIDQTDMAAVKGDRWRKIVYIYR